VSAVLHTAFTLPSPNPLVTIHRIKSLLLQTLTMYPLDGFRSPEPVIQSKITKTFVVAELNEEHGEGDIKRLRLGENRSDEESGITARSGIVMKGRLPDDRSARPSTLDG
jgi:hypothetical protein